MDGTEYTDEEIVLTIQRGDKEHYGILMQRYEERLLRYGRKFLADPENIGDIVQDVFISAYQNLNNFDPSLKFSSWIYRIAHNAFVNGLKRQQKGSVLGLDLDTFVSHTVYQNPEQEERERKEMKTMIDKGLETLKPKYKEVIILHHLEDLSYKEISDILQIPTGTVGVRVMRGREALKKIYEKMNLTYEH